MKRGWLAGCVILGCSISAVAHSADRLVRVSPIKGIVIGVPKGWKACELYFDQKLGKAEDPHSLYKKACDAVGGNSIYKLGAFSPVSPKISTVYVLYRNLSPVTSQTIRGLTDENLQNITAAMCGEWTKTAVRDRTTLDSCKVRADSLDGSPALVTTVLQTHRDAAIGQFVTEIWEVPYEYGFIQFNFSWNKDGGSESAIDRIKDSIDID